MSWRCGTLSDEIWLSGMNLPKTIWKAMALRSSDVRGNALLVFAHLWHPVGRRRIPRRRRGSLDHVLRCCHFSTSRLPRSNLLSSRMKLNFRGFVEVVAK